MTFAHPNPQAACPWCGIMPSGELSPGGMNDGKQDPEPGDLAICRMCHGVTVFEADAPPRRARIMDLTSLCAADRRLLWDAMLQDGRPIKDKIEVSQ